MTLDSEKMLDAVSWKILKALQNDARLSFTELGKIVGLSSPAAAERVRRLEEAGIITGYRAELNLEKIGILLIAFIRLNTPTEKYPEVLAYASSTPEIVECHHLAGNDSFIIKAMLASIADLELLIARLSKFGQTTTSIALSSPVVKPFPELIRPVK